jgi:AraC family transcriptional regulator of adaptative response/methylated-DNA-[protein]-cysteine methyltransferase
MSPLGILLAAQTHRGLCAIFLGDEKLALIHALQQRFPQAHYVPENQQLNTSLEGLVSYIITPKAPLDLELDIQGSAFSQQVWAALRTIPLGKTMSYTEVAERIGAPRAVRAVAHACAINNLSIVIPCHRVIGKNGLLTGYRWGIERKKALLNAERQFMMSQ